MAFSMSKVKVKKRNVDINIRDIFSDLGNDPIISDNVKEALNIYLRYRLKQFGVIGLQNNGFKRLVEDLLEKCCDKPINQISRRDVVLNERCIIYHIKKALELRALKTIYCRGNEYISTNITNDYIKPRNDKTYIDSEIVREYLKEFELI